MDPFMRSRLAPSPRPLYHRLMKLWLLALGGMVLWGSAAAGVQNPAVTLPASFLRFEAEIGLGNPPAQLVTVDLPGDSSGAWQATADQDWLALRPAEGNGAGPVSISVNTHLLPPGTHTGKVTVQRVDASEDSTVIDVTLALSAPAATDSIGWAWQNRTPTGNTLAAIWGVGPEAIFAVGTWGTIVHYDGTGWRNMDSGVDVLLTDIWGSGPDNLFVVGEKGVILHYDGNRWTPMDAGVLQIGDDILDINWTLNAIWGNGPDDVYIVGEIGTILHYDGSGWRSMSSGTTQGFHAVWGSGPNNIFAGGINGRIHHYDGTVWTQMTETSGGPQINSIWGRSPTDVFAVGSDGTLLHFDGSSWQAVKNDVMATLYDIWGTDDGDLYVQTDGAYLHYDGSQWVSHPLLVDIPSLSMSGTWGTGPDNLFFAGSPETLLHANRINQVPILTGERLWFLNDIWGIGSENLYAVGAWGNLGSARGVVLHYDGIWWREMNVSTRQLNSIWGSGPDHIFTVGAEGAIVHFDGGSWTAMASPTASTLDSVWGSGPDNVFAVGFSGTILHYDGNAWTPMPSGTAARLTVVWGSSATDVYAAGEDNTLLHFDGQGWQPVDHQVEADRTIMFTDGWSRAHDDVYALAWGLLFHFDGNVWTLVDETELDFFRLWSGADGMLYALGGDTIRGASYVGRFDGTSWTIPCARTSGLRGLWETKDGLIVVGQASAILKLDLQSWRACGEIAPSIPSESEPVYLPFVRSN